MAGRVKTNERQPLEWLIYSRGYNKQNICAALSISYMTMESYINNPFIMPLHRIVTLSGLFGITPPQLVDLLLHNKPGTKKDMVKVNERLSKWYDKPL